MATRINVSTQTVEQARKAFMLMKAHWAVTEVSWDGISLRFSFEAPNKPARRSISSALHQLGVEFQLSPVTAPRTSTETTRRRGRKSNRPDDAEFLQSLRDHGVEGTASRYDVTPATVKNFWAKAVSGAEDIISGG